MLIKVAREKITGDGQQAFDLDGLSEECSAGLDSAGMRIVGTRPRLLWEALEWVCTQLGFANAVNDEVFKQLVLTRIIEPASKAESLRVLQRLGVEDIPSLRTVWRRLATCQGENWRGALCQAAYRHAAGDEGAVAVVLYDLTTLYFETDEEDEHRKVGYSNCVEVSVMPMFSARRRCWCWSAGSLGWAARHNPDGLRGIHSCSRKAISGSSGR